MTQVLLASGRSDQPIATYNQRGHMSLFLPRIVLLSVAIAACSPTNTAKQQEAIDGEGADEIPSDEAIKAEGSGPAFSPSVGAFALAMGSKIGEQDYNQELDFNNDGVIDAQDYDAFVAGARLSLKGEDLVRWNAFVMVDKNRDARLTAVEGYVAITNILANFGRVQGQAPLRKDLDVDGSGWVVNRDLTYVAATVRGVAEPAETSKFNMYVMFPRLLTTKVAASGAVDINGATSSYIDTIVALSHTMTTSSTDRYYDFNVDGVVDLQDAQLAVSSSAGLFYLIENPLVAAYFRAVLTLYQSIPDFESPTATSVVQILNQAVAGADLSKFDVNQDSKIDQADEAILTTAAALLINSKASQEERGTFAAYLLTKGITFEEVVEQAKNFHD